MCWSVFEETTKAKATLPEKLTAAALAGAERAVKLDPGNSHILDTLAQLLAQTGEIDRAITLETQALAKETDEETKSMFRKTLKLLQLKRAETSPAKQ